MSGSRIQDVVETFVVPADSELPPVADEPAFAVPPDDYVIEIAGDDNVIVIEV